MCLDFINFFQPFLSQLPNLHASRFVWLSNASKKVSARVQEPDLAKCVVGHDTFFDTAIFQQVHIARIAHEDSSVELPWNVGHIQYLVLTIVSFFDIALV